MDTVGKVLEKIFRLPLLSAIHDTGDLSSRQYGFRVGRSAIDADPGVEASEGLWVITNVRGV